MPIMLIYVSSRWIFNFALDLDGLVYASRHLDKIMYKNAKLEIVQTLALFSSVRLARYLLLKSFTSLSTVYQDKKSSHFMPNFLKTI